MRGPSVHPIVIAAGGTGGHFFPAEALAAELAARGHRIVLMTDQRAAARLPESFQGREVHVLRGAGVAGRGLRRQASALTNLGIGALQARSALALLNAAAIVGFGGYPVVAPVLGSRLLRDRPPVILHDQNAVLGTANRAMARFATALALSFPVVTRVPAGAKTELTGNPVRPAFAGTRPEPDGRLHLLILGGSLGARVFSDVMPDALAALPPALRARLSVVQQCRSEDLDRVRAAYAASGIAAELSAFFPDVPARMLRADLFIGRAGGSTVAELTAAGLPAILVPLPIAVNDEQGGNAKALADAGAAWVIRQPDLTSAGLAERIAGLLTDPATLARARQATTALTRPDAAVRLADLVLSYAKVRS